MLALMALRQTLTLIDHSDSFTLKLQMETMQELPGLIVSVLAFIALYYLKETIMEHNQSLASKYKLESRLAGIVNNAFDAIITVDKSQRIVTFNKGAERIFGYDEDEIIGEKQEVLIPPRFVEKHRKYIDEFPIHPDKSRQMKVASSKIFARRKNGEEFPIEANISMTTIANETYFTAILRDITKQTKAEEDLEHMAFYDTLTALPNRLFFQKILHQRIASLNDSFAVLSIGLDHFKAINETLGYPAGDMALKAVAHRLQLFVDDQQHISRLGGDIFAILLPSQKKSENYTSLAEKIIDTFALPISIAGNAINIELSIGIAIYPLHGKDANSLTVCAETAMQFAKSTHQHFSTFAPEMQKDSLDHLQLVGELRHAIKQNQLVLHYQPKIDMNTACAIGVEALIRWQHPDKGFMSPGIFIPIAEKTGLIHSLTYWVINEALNQAKLWREQGIELLMSINLSVYNLQDERLVEHLGETLKTHGIPPSNLVLEITESSLMTNPELARTTLNQLHSMGVKLSIDDFGTGHSSLAYLKDLPIDELKIDQSFISNISTDEKQALIVQSTISLAHSLGLTTTAEGLETEDGWRHLQNLGCNLGQGYLISKPLASDDLVHWLTESDEARKALQLQESP
jgi:diguanylate cyclase (GGDEF)-like protein/PAS domain S-box-containing protein